MEFEIRKIQKTDDLKSLCLIFNDVFESRPKNEASNTYLDNLLNNESFFSLGLYINNEIVGGLTAYELELISGIKEFYIYDIGIKSNFQRKGFGKKLISELKLEAGKRKISTIFIEAEDDDSDAVSFYRSLNQEEVGVRHFNISV